MASAESKSGNEEAGEEGLLGLIARSLLLGLVAMRHRPGRRRFAVDPYYEGLAIRKFRRKTRTAIRQAMAEDNVDNMILPHTLSEMEDPWCWD